MNPSTAKCGVCNKNCESISVALLHMSYEHSNYARPNCSNCRIPKTVTINFKTECSSCQKKCTVVVVNDQRVENQVLKEGGLSDRDFMFQNNVQQQKAEAEEELNHCRWGRS